MTSGELVSVIIPAYNAEQYIEACLNSFLVQTYEPIEWILVDDGSTDRTGEIMERYADKDGRIRVFHKPNGGISDARNFGIDRASGAYIVFSDSDDTVDPDYVAYLYGLLKKYDTDMALCQLRVVFDGRRTEDPGKPGDRLMNGKECAEELLYHGLVDTAAQAKIYKKELFEGISYPVGKIFEDAGTTYKLILKCDRIAVGLESKYNYYVHNQSIVNSGFNARKLDMLEMTDQMTAAITERFPELEKGARRRRVYARLSTLNQMRNTKEYPEIKKELILYIRENGKQVLKDPRTGARDRVAIHLIRLGYPVYKAAWAVYLKGKKNLS